MAVSSSRSSASPAGSPTRPPPSPYQLRCRIDAASSSRRRASADRGAGCAGLQHPQLGEVRGQLRVVRGPDRGHPADQGPGALGPLEHQVRAGRRRARSAGRAAARSRPCPTRVLCRSRLPNDDCQACRSVSPARTCRRATDGRPRASASSACTSRQCRRTASGSRSRTRVRRSRSAASSRSPRAVASRIACRRSGSACACVVARLEGAGQLVEAATERGSPASRWRPRRPPRRRPPAGPAARRPGSRKRRAARRATTRARAGSPRSRVWASASSQSAWNRRSRWAPYADGAASSARAASRDMPAAISTSARSCSTVAR